MYVFKLIALIIFAFSYILISLEHKIKINKSAISLATAGLLWIIVVFSNHQKKEIIHTIENAGSEIFGIIIFLLAAMTLVEILVHYNFFDFIRTQIIKLKLNDRKKFLIIGSLTFFLSAIFDNLTITIVMVQLAKRFFKNNNLLIAASGIVILANAGGAWSPIGDVTTIMIWLSNKFSALQIFSQGIIPSLVLGIIVLFLLAKQINKETPDLIEENVSFTKSEKLIIFVVIASFILPLFMNLFGLPPYMGLLFGLGIVWILIEYAQIRSKNKTHLEADIQRLLTKVDIVSLKFFTGILLSVSALKTLKILENLSVIIFGQNQETIRVIIGNIILGALSSIVDNVPLTAVAINMITLNDPSIWVLLALAVGTGGSFLIIGSVAGVVAMGMIKKLNFQIYFKIAFLPAVIGYIAAMLTWFLQYLLIR